MLMTELKEYLTAIEQDYMRFYITKDEETLPYLIEDIDSLYQELSAYLFAKGDLYNLIYNVYRKNILIIFENLKNYSVKVSKTSKKTFDELIKVSTSNRYVEFKNINGLYKNFQNEVLKNMSIKDKITALINANTDTLKGQLYAKCVISDKDQTNKIFEKHNKNLEELLTKNIFSKRDILISYYKEFIDSILNDLYEEKDNIKNKNLKTVVNVSYNYLKEKEYININKYIDENAKFISESFNRLEDRLLNELGIRKANTKINPIKDYLLGFNNTIGIKSKNVFDEMNQIVLLDKDKVKEKVKQFNDLITHIYEIKLVFDKQFLSYKKEFNCFTKNQAAFDKIFERESARLTEGMKANISNIFRDNIKIYNDIVYKTLLLKSKINEYNTLLTNDKIKDLLLK